MTKKKERIENYYKIVILFTIGCFLGCVFETLLCFAQRGYFESRKGLIYGPFNPVYGIGVTGIVLVLEKYKKNMSYFLIGALTGGIIEYLCSWIQEKLFGTLSWDYSNYFLNFDGRTSIYHMIWWGILSLVFMKLVYPKIEEIIKNTAKRHHLKIAIGITIFFVINSLISGYASYRQKERAQNIKATTIYQKIFDKYYPDEFLDKIYPNREEAKIKKQTMKNKK